MPPKKNLEQIVEEIAPPVGDFKVTKPRTIYDLGWTKEEAALARAQMSAFIDIWDDPEMDVYDEEAI